MRKPRPEDELVQEIQNKVVTGVALAPYLVQMLEPGTLPRTSSGKLRRNDALRMFLTGELLPPEKMTAVKLLKELGKSQVSWGRFWLKNRDKA